MLIDGILLPGKLGGAVTQVMMGKLAGYRVYNG